MWDLGSRPGQTCIPSFARQILNHWTPGSPTNMILAEPVPGGRTMDKVLRWFFETLLSLAKRALDFSLSPLAQTAPRWIQVLCWGLAFPLIRKICLLSGWSLRLNFLGLLFSRAFHQILLPESQQDTRPLILVSLGAGDTDQGKKNFVNCDSNTIEKLSKFSIKYPRSVLEKCVHSID